ncbi:protein of unknown function [Marinobacter sp. DSM 26671]|jgi:hypothetical protein|uniref:DUF4956 domain-containing protein n=2 Tax=Marinobacter TaxID=2742 RepID=A0A352IXL2_9GAMM|nr:MULTISPECIES: DUF4956 domain-containing protein [Marinobacter]MAM53018.1 DUF4956 domain-containing protein [Marinobacter sp.]MEC7727891.1 DUF4956 domain-containing protein [Pseudomonadota bacterium]EHJ05670.1 hypothetical protein KYE_05166 [Marinobacter manganoxydans MnI7-9]MBW3226747.1 DUF4956 domain-containing protein [Marinobacter adhaerens]MCW8978131.1 DUF4956 domain-containing protein [Marinobacter sp.]|tara:strand:- start:717 stop:1301 length:585 start_codon:yes stop_codon:yes gene_type:complete
MESAVDVHFAIRLLINTASVFVLIRCYYAFSRHRENAASFILFGVGVFLVTALLHSVTVTMGFAFGLFAVFSMLRYRTEALGIKEMTYLFLVIAMALLAAVGNMHHLELVFLNLLVIVLALVLETRVLLPRHSEREVEYEKIENVHRDRRELLIADLRERTGLDVFRVDVVSVSYLRDTAMLRMHFRQEADHAR